MSRGSIQIDDNAIEFRDIFLSHRRRSLRISVGHLNGNNSTLSIARYFRAIFQDLARGFRGDSPSIQAVDSLKAKLANDVVLNCSTRQHPHEEITRSL